MNIYLINLDKDEDRFASADQQLRALGVDYERIPAVYGRHVVNGDRRRACSLFRWWAAVGWKMSDGELGCALSHQKIYEKMIADQIEQACILEDDVVLDSRFGEFIRTFTLPNNNKPIVCLLSDHTINPRVKDGTIPADNRTWFDLEKATGDTCTEAYCLNLEAARFLRRMNYPVMIYADAWRRWAGFGLKLYHVRPTLATQDQVTFGGSTVGLRKTVSQMNVSERILYKCNRAAGKCIDYILQRVTRR